MLAVDGTEGHVAEGTVARPWDELVSEGRRALSDAAWKLGDLALEVEVTRGGGELQRYATEVGVAHERLEELRWVASRWPTESLARAKLSWSVARTLAGQSDRFELVEARTWTVTEAKELVKHRRQELTQAREQAQEVASAAGERVAELDDKLEQLRAQAAAPTLLGDLYTDVKAREDARTRKSVVRWAHDSGEHEGLVVDGCPVCGAENAARAPLGLYMKMPEVWQDVRDLARQVQDSAGVLSARDRDLVVRNVNTVRAALDLIEATARSGEVTDEALQALIDSTKALEGEQP